MIDRDCLVAVSCSGFTFFKEKKKRGTRLLGNFFLVVARIYFFWLAVFLGGGMGTRDTSYFLVPSNNRN